MSGGDVFYVSVLKIDRGVGVVLKTGSLILGLHRLLQTVGPEDGVIGLLEGEVLRLVDVILSLFFSGCFGSLTQVDAALLGTRKMECYPLLLLLLFPV